nr:hypothetical protein [Helicobacter suis]
MKENRLVVLAHPNLKEAHPEYGSKSRANVIKGGYNYLTVSNVLV